jgi:AcrR family transcriptional regulator
MLNAALDLIVEGGPRAASMTRVAERLGASSGSLYHRFGARDELLAALWLDVVESFQTAFLSALMAEPEQGARRAALVPLHWLRSRPRETHLLLAYRREDLLDGDWPPVVRERAQIVTDELDDGIRTFARRTLGSADARSVRAVRFAVIDVPAGAMRPYLRPLRRPPADLDGLVLTAVDAVLLAASREGGRE